MSAGSPPCLLKGRLLSSHPFYRKQCAKWLALFVDPKYATKSPYSTSRLRRVATSHTAPKPTELSVQVGRGTWKVRPVDPGGNQTLFGQQYGVRRRQVTHRVKTGRYTHAVKGYRAWRGGRADQQDQDQSELQAPHG